MKLGSLKLRDKLPSDIHIRVPKWLLTFWLLRLTFVGSGNIHNCPECPRRFRDTKSVPKLWRLKRPCIFCGRLNEYVRVHNFMSSLSTITGLNTCQAVEDTTFFKIDIDKILFFYKKIVCITADNLYRCRVEPWEDVHRPKMTIDIVVHLIRSNSWVATNQKKRKIVCQRFPNCFLEKSWCSGKQ